jgi:hypothetical protein
VLIFLADMKWELELLDVLQPSVSSRSSNGNVERARRYKTDGDVSMIQHIQRVRVRRMKSLRWGLFRGIYSENGVWQHSFK